MGGGAPRHCRERKQGWDGKREAPPLQGLGRGLPWKGWRACGEREVEALTENGGEALVGGFSITPGKTRDGRDLVPEVGGLE